MLSLRTEKADEVFAGQNYQNNQRHGHGGHNHFIRRVQSAIKSSEQGDPYADITLLRVERSLKRAANNIGKLKNRVNTRIEKFSTQYGFAIEPVVGKVISQHRIPIRSLYSVESAKLIMELDTFVLITNTALRAGIINKKDQNFFAHRAANELRKCYLLPNNYKPSGITRRDIIVKNEKANKVIKERGIPHREIMNQKLKPLCLSYEYGQDA